MIFESVRILMHHVDGVLLNGVEGGYRFRVGLEGALRNNQIGKLGGDIHVRCLEGASSMVPSPPVPEVPMVAAPLACVV